MFFVVTLVILFRAPEDRRRRNFRRDGLRKFSRFLELLHRDSRDFRLLVGVRKNRRAILRADIRPLAISLRRVMKRKKMQ